MSATTRSAVTSSKNMSVRISPAADSSSARNGSHPASRSAGAMSVSYSSSKSTRNDGLPSASDGTSFVPNGIATNARARMRSARELIDAA